MTSNATELAPPPRMARLPKDPTRPYLVPWFVAWIDGKPDFRVIRPGGIATAVRENKCWLCGQQLGRYMAFVVGPMCAVNRTSAEPPSHRDCAAYAAQVCPFLTRPDMRRRERGLPEDRVEPAGIGLDRNPGVTLVWVTRSYRIYRATYGARGVLFDMGMPTETLWYAQGRSATRDEVTASIDSGLPALREIAIAEGNGAVADLDRRVKLVMAKWAPQ